ncbi:DUF4188 domain-containing protein [Arthrobacter sp. CG_A4]|uniref:DUF4188 domain-containing protein n=1 Tax=Arthrobacter sp. CG_A4 TaxID=3071706 RepID=UPI002E02DB55|nr:hypothetical protein [Arthrobacter sp. CG_A4]
MARINAGRFTHRHSGGLVVFLIGMRINRPWRPDLWLPAFLAMPKMLAELLAEPGSGLLGYRFSMGAGGPVIVQYWDSVENLYAYASAPESGHRPAWTAFNRRAREVPGAVGIWHETFQVSHAESMYVSMPTQGLAQATELVPVGPRTDRAKDRLAGAQ